jgi:pimeloyl-ACP methyl ester carboxylesterase
MVQAIFKMKTLILLSIFFTMTSFAQNMTFDLSQNYSGFVDIRTKEIYVEYLAPEKNKSTLVLLNGLTYTTVQWAFLVSELRKNGYGILRFDFNGMGMTELRNGVSMAPYMYTEQIEDVEALLSTLQIPKPYNLVGLSYGGGISAGYSFKYPQNINKLILMSPYTEPLAQQDVMIKQQVAMARVLNPLNPMTDDQVYDFYLHQLCYSFYPAAEPVVLENPIKLEGIFRLTQGIRKFRPVDETLKFPPHSVFLFIAENDQYIPRNTLDNFWDAIPAESKVAKFIIKNSEHKIPEFQPVQAANLIHQIIGE